MMRVQIPRLMLALLCGATLLAAAIPAAQAQQAGTTFRDCDDCPEMVVVPAGSFMMGADKNFEDARDSETPRHRVTIARPFAIGKYEVTQGEWVAVMGNNPSRVKGRSLPMGWVSWFDAEFFIRNLNVKTGKNYRLLTEAEWEYAARAGSDSAWSWGDDASKANQYAWFSGNSGQEAHPVGQLRPNRFGLHDMHGNVEEWVQDCQTDNYASAPTDGSAVTGKHFCDRTVRGGSYFDDPGYLRSATRSWPAPKAREEFRGFRLARTLP